MSSRSPISPPRLRQSRIDGIETNLAYLVSILEHPVFAAGEQTTAMLQRHAPPASSIEVLAAGTLTTVQDWPGRLGLWDVGVPPSGPMDRCALRLANRMVGNDGRRGGAGDDRDRRDAALRRRRGDRTRRRRRWKRRSMALPCRSGNRCRCSAAACSRSGRIAGAGQRAYLAVRGSFDIP